MSAFISIALAATLTAGPAGLDSPMAIQGPAIRVVEGVFVQHADEDFIQYFERDADLPPNMEQMATMTRSGMTGRVVRVSPNSDNELRLIAERPQAFDLFEPEYEGQEVDGVVAVMDDEWGEPLLFVTSDRNDIMGIVVYGPDDYMHVIERNPQSSMPMDISYKDTVIGIVVPNPRGGMNVLMDEVNPLEAQGLLHMYRPMEEKPEAGQN